MCISSGLTNRLIRFLHWLPAWVFPTEQKPNCPEIVRVFLKVGYEVEREEDERDWLFWSWSGRIEISEDHDELLQGTQFRLQFSDISRSIPTSNCCLHHRQLLLQLMEAAAVHSQPFRGRQQHPHWPMPNGHRPPHDCAKRVKYVLQLGRTNHSHIAFSPTKRSSDKRGICARIQ